MRTLAIILVCTVIALMIGIPTGIWMSRSDRVQAIITPVLDVMQTMPIFVYLIPVVMLLGLGKIPGMLAVVVYAIPPVIRLTNLGIRLVDKDVIEAADAFGAGTWQKAGPRSITACTAQYYGRHQSNNHDGVVHGQRHRLINDRCERSWPARFTSGNQSIFCPRPLQRAGRRRPSHRFRPRFSKLWQTASTASVSLIMNE